MFRVWSTMLFLEVPMNKAVEFTRVFIIGSQREQVGRGFTCCFSCQYLLFTCGYQTVAYVNIQRRVFWVITCKGLFQRSCWDTASVAKVQLQMVLMTVWLSSSWSVVTFLALFLRPNLTAHQQIPSAVPSWKGVAELEMMEMSAGTVKQLQIWVSAR